MISNADAAGQLQTLLKLRVLPVGLIFSDAPLPGIARVDEAAPAGCAYWKRAAKGEVFYTTGADHLGCAIGAHTHAAELTPEAETNLMAMIGMMTESGYLTEAEIPLIPRRASKLEILTYGPLAKLPREPDLVLLRTTPRAAMLLSEATHAAGVRSDHAPGLRPGCAMVPDVLATKRAATSLACIGNRVYTDLPDDEMWCALSGNQVAPVLSRLATLVEANRKLEAFHSARV
jgi:uncharacterized protein (DUF169 family)